MPVKSMRHFSVPWARAKNCPSPNTDTSSQSTGSSASTKTSTTSASMSKSKIPGYLLLPSDELKLKFNEIKLMEDERIHDAIVHKDTSKWSMQSGIEAFKLGRNRYTNILPFDKNRVKLGVRNGFNDYINASHVVLDLDQSKKYIATQGPTKSTISHFWQMILQQTKKGEDAVIVMVTPLQERNVTKCSKYWIDRVNETIDIPGFHEGFDYDLSLKCLDYYDVDEIPGTHYTMIQLDVIDPETKETIDTRSIHHLYYDKWTDFMKPDAWEPIHAISNLVTSLNGESNPLFVHCSAGVGRTGTFITLDYLFHSQDLLQQNDSDVVEKVVKQLRKQRLLMVQSVDQFKFCYEATCQFFHGI